MTTALMTVLVVLDLGLIAAILLINRRQGVQTDLLDEMNEERRLLSDLRETVKGELEAAQFKARETLDKAAKLAAEAEHEIKVGGSSLASEMEGVAAELSSRLDTPLKELTRKQNSMENLLRRIEQEKQVLTKLLQRGEKICRFFDNRVPYEEVLREIEDKKYADARSLLARGTSPSKVAHELGMSETEVRLIAGLSPG